jgi:hypothetical protein
MSVRTTHDVRTKAYSSVDEWAQIKVALTDRSQLYSQLHEHKVLSVESCRADSRVKQFEHVDVFKLFGAAVSPRGLQ